MDPTITVGNVFSLKGSQNHIISQQWKEAVSKERQLLKRWKSKYAKHIIEVENGLLNDTIKKEKEVAKQKAQPRSSNQLVLYEDGKGRLPYLKQQKQKSPHQKAATPLTASQVVGWHSATSTRTDFEKTEWGHKPIVMSSFFRKCGVF
eukprot:TRINITY_DN28131_c0_g1_i1.p1 TRINITY_DN28131_c0_g1~~TRINITY_DN28131_c0_g1_i1.p1  ORF type:complete len:159 (+),score=38.48 TRINITY_DN28131_c0_g1_i1:36-479(+)